MIRLAIAFLAGMVTSAVIVFYAVGHIAAAMFGLGVATVILAAAVALGSRERIKRAARVLDAFACALDARKQPVAISSKAKSAVAIVPPTQLENDLADALTGLGAKGCRAVDTARRVIAENPGAPFDTLLRVAIQGTRKSA